MVEQLIRNQLVRGSSPLAGTFTINALGVITISAKYLRATYELPMNAFLIKHAFHIIPNQKDKEAADGIKI